MFLKLFFIIFVNFISLSNLNAHHPGNKIEAKMPYPKIDIEVTRDKIEGYNLFFNLQNFKISPYDIEIKNDDNSGYLQLFINDIKISRIYSNWYHAPERFFNQKENSIRIKLFTNLHDELSINNQPIEFEFKLLK
tara:strand:- start:350 stop:754 length:405 start_codon:yes stop_codon:yes gene_type:complete